MDGIPDLRTFGKYKQGLTSAEITEYICHVYNSVTHKDVKTCPKKIIAKFYDIAGVNTVAVSPDGETLMYRWDVERFVGKLFFNTDVYFD